MWLPKAVFEHVLISLPVLKAHSLSRLTGSMKNMIGIAPPKHYSGQHGFWKKAVFHHHLDQAIVDLISYRKPDFTIMDATIGLADRWPSCLILDSIQGDGLFENIKCLIIIQDWRVVFEIPQHRY